MSVKPSAADELARRNLLLSLSITAAIFLLELAGGLYTNSLALLSDSGHVLADLLSLAVTLFALGLALRPPTSKLTFGYHRYEVFAALINGGLLLLSALFILYEAYARLLNPVPVSVPEVILIAAVGLAGNLFVVYKLRGFGSTNIEAALLHAASDSLAFLGVIFSSVAVAVTGAVILDTVAAVLISGLILAAAWRVVRESLHILSESCPIEISPEKVLTAIRGTPSVLGVHDMHTWCVCSDIVYVTAHVIVKNVRVSRTSRLQDQLVSKLAHLGVTNSAFQFETSKSRHKRAAFAAHKHK